MWLANFDTLEAPLHNGTQRVPHEPVVAEWLFFPHPVYRQGVLLRFSKKTPVTMHLPTIPTAGQRAGGRPLSDAVGGRGVPEFHDARGVARMKRASASAVYLLSGTQDDLFARYLRDFADVEKANKNWPE